MPDSQIKIAAHEANIASNQIRVLCVDDEVFNLDILEKHLLKADYDVIRAVDGTDALEVLATKNHNIDIVLLDRMMPKMDGLDVLRKMKDNANLSHIPVIMQTAMAAPEDSVAGIEAGAYYYITKPYEAEVLISIVEAASRESQERTKFETRLKKADSVLQYAVSGEYQFKSLEAGREIAAFLSSFASDSSKAIIILTALISNAIEHGNLEIGYELKGDLLRDGAYNAEFTKRAQNPKYKDRKVTVSFQRTGKQVTVDIEDEGEGFLWNSYMEFDPVRLTDPNGRGIAIANAASKNAIKYSNGGRKVSYNISK